MADYNASKIATKGLQEQIKNKQEALDNKCKENQDLQKKIVSLEKEIQKMKDSTGKSDKDKQIKQLQKENK